MLGAEERVTRKEIGEGSPKNYLRVSVSFFLVRWSNFLFLKLPQFVPDSTSTAVLCQIALFNQVSEVHFQGVATDASQLDSIAYRYASMFTDKFDDMQ